MKHTTPLLTYEVKGYRELRTHEGYAYTYTLWIDGKAACTVENRGDGGALWACWQMSGASSMWGTAGSSAATKVLKYIATLPPITDPKYPPLVVDMELWLGEIAEEFVHERKLSRLCRTKTVFRVAGDKEDRWIVASRPYTPAFAEELRAKQKKAVEFWNERVTS